MERELHCWVDNNNNINYPTGRRRRTAVAVLRCWLDDLGVWTRSGSAALCAGSLDRIPFHFPNLVHRVVTDNGDGRVTAPHHHLAPCECHTLKRLISIYTGGMCISKFLRWRIRGFYCIALGSTLDLRLQLNCCIFTFPSFDDKLIFVHFWTLSAWMSSLINGRVGGRHYKLFILLTGDLLSYGYV